MNAPLKIKRGNRANQIYLGLFGSAFFGFILDVCEMPKWVTGIVGYFTLAFLSCLFFFVEVEFDSDGRVVVAVTRLFGRITVFRKPHPYSSFTGVQCRTKEVSESTVDTWTVGLVLTTGKFVWATEFSGERSSLCREAVQVQLSQTIAAATGLPILETEQVA
ncbi:MAG: hypothetical protein JWM68_4502 [Verrucomicrobiales bacterium]|nr:hypothetical protein [Verrucomicrobiales bacterium]